MHYHRYSPKAVANFFLQRAWSEGVNLDQLQVQKLVFFAHGWFLGNTGLPLVNEQVEAWRHGPVFRSLYSEFTRFGRQPIGRLAQEYDFNRGCAVEPKVNEGDAAIVQFLDGVWRSNKGFTGLQLSNMTHAPGGPWDSVRTAYGDGTPIIPEGLIADYFGGLLGKNVGPAAR